MLSSQLITVFVTFGNQPCLLCGHDFANKRLVTGESMS